MIFLFKDGLSLIIKKLSFSSSKILLFRRVRILESSQHAQWLQMIAYGAVLRLHLVFGKW